MPNKKYMDEHLLLHTLRIELMNGKVLAYNIDAHLELGRAFIYPDEIWEEMEEMRKMEDNKN